MSDNKQFRQTGAPGTAPQAKSLSKRIRIPVTVKLLSDTIFSSGYSIPGGEDVAVKIGTDGMPVLAGSTFKGLFRESLENLLVWTGSSDVEETTDALLGSRSRMDAESERRIVFSSFRMKENGEWASYRSFTQLQDGMAKEGTLRTVGCIRNGIEFEGTILCSSDDEALVRQVLQGIKYAGLMRNRGFGHIRISSGKPEKITSVTRTGSSAHIRYRLKTLAPLAIPVYNPDPSDVKKNYTDTAKSIPGTVIRGMVISVLANNADFEQLKETLLCNVRFSCALPVLHGQPALPAIKGFYGDKAETDFYNVLLEDVKPGHKRAGLGSFCVPEAGKLKCFSPATVSALRIKLEDESSDKEVFTTAAIAPGEVFEGYIDAPDSAVAERIASVFGNVISIGADRYAGNGLCEVTELDAAEEAAWRYGYSENDSIPQDLHMLLLSPGSMTSVGVSCGLDEAKLAQLLGVESVRIGRSAASTVEISGYNRMYGCPCDTETMYDAGSIFTLHCTPAPSHQAIAELQATGIGTRTAEGFGKVLFLKGLADLTGKVRADAPAGANTEAIREKALRTYWLLTHDLPKGLSNSQMGTVQAICESMIASGKDTAELEEHFRHNMEDRGPYHGDGFKKVYEALQPIWFGKTEIPGCRDLTARLQLITDWIDLSRKEG